MPTEPAADPGPLALDEFASLIDVACPLPKGAVFGVAVSGGGDSMALALLAQDYARSSGRILRTITIDHGLRSDSAAEAQQVHDWLAARTIAHDVVAWRGEKPTSGIQDAARAARYRLIGAWARTQGISYVMVAHQLEDQAETFLMRLARGSGIGGLAAMRGLTMREGIRLCRPLLGVPRERLRATLRAAGQEWIEDPSNEAAKFARTGYRRLIAGLETHGAGAGRLAALAADFAQLDALMGAAARRFLGEMAIRGPDGSIVIAHHAYRELPEPVAGRVLRDVLAEVGGKPLAPRGDRLARAQGRLTAAPEAGKRPTFTLGGCRIRVARGNIQIRPETGRKSS